LKIVLDNGLLNVLTVYAPHSGKLEEEEESFWNTMFHLMSCISQNEMVVLDDDINRVQRAVKQLCVCVCDKFMEDILYFVLILYLIIITCFV